MCRKNKRVIRWPTLIEYLGMVAILMACTVRGGATQVRTEEASLRLDNSVVEMQNESGDWAPVSAESTFELVGELESTDPWKVTGNTFATRESTQIDEGLEAGDLVRVKGLILEDDTWLASSIEKIEEQSNAAIILIGKVNSTDPWVVNGITHNVTGDTVITGEITPDMLVRVEILLLEDGTWEVLSIAPLGDLTGIPGCATVAATVVSVNGNEVQFAGWPAITLDEDVSIENEVGDEATLSANQFVLVVVCASEDG